MVLEPGALLGHYEIVALVGRGGMGEVYKARDTRLGRFVAIKVITAAHAAGVDDRRRFEEECRLTATLVHPRICAVHDVGVHGGALYLVMEFLDGTSLADRMARGPLSRSQSLGYAIEIAGAIHYAHRRGVVHRDLTPSNIFITSAGVKVIDFGIATLRHAEAPVTPEAAAERTAARRTRPGLVVGTTYYLSPERLEGKAADHRTDVFGFGAIVYEMATGRRAFEAPSPAGLVAAILTTDPAPLPPESELADLNWILQRCLAKDPDDRWQSLGDVEAILKSIARTPVRPTRPAGIASSPRALLALFGCAILFILAAVTFRAYRGPSPIGRSDVVAFTIAPPTGGTFTPTEGSIASAQLAVSPDGSEVAFVAAGPENVSEIWVRALGFAEARPLKGTEGAAYPFWSPDGRELAFFVGNELRRIDRRGGPARRIATARTGRGGTWNADNVILFAPEPSGRLTRINLDGTGSADQTTVDSAAGETDHRWPQFLPDGRHFIFFVRSTNHEKQGVYLGSLDSPNRTLIVRSNSSGQYAAPRSLLYVVDGTLMAAPLDIAAGRLAGDPVAVAPRVGTSTNFYSAVSASSTGVLAYGGRTTLGEELVWMNRNGEPDGTVAAGSVYVDFRISPDSRYVAISNAAPESDNSDISVLDILQERTARLTITQSTDASPVWSPDGSHIVFRSNRERSHDLYVRNVSRGDADMLFLKSQRGKYPTAWARSGLIIYQTKNEHTNWDVLAAAWPGPSEGQPLIKDSQFNEVQAQLSPNERWLAYTSDRSGLYEVYVQALKNPGQPVPISTHRAADPSWRGAVDPRWRADGKELFYVTADGGLTAVPVLDGGLEFGRPQTLFTISPPTIASPYPSGYDPAADGSRFLVRIRREDARTLPLRVVTNWTDYSAKLRTDSR